MKVAGSLAALFGLCLLAPGARAADATWFDPGDAGLRLDLQLLNDAEVIRLPVNQWPLPRAAVRHALGNAKEFAATNSAVAAALARVRARIAGRGSLSFGVSASGGQAALLRDYDSLAREDAEVGGRIDWSSGRFAVSLNATGVADPEDGQEIRADGSHATLQLGNWLLSANTLERWWGPAHSGSLILSNNARPMPTVMVERAEARTFDTPWLNWLGPWRFNFALSRMEGSREDIDAPLFLAWRVTVMPFKDIELGFSRTAQFCGEQLSCNLDVFADLLVGNDNIGFDATPESEPGNQMAGFDMRWNSPIGNLPYAVYAQFIGEDESGYLPAKFLRQAGFEIWRPRADGSILQWYAEYTDVSCETSPSKRYNCAYNQGRFDVEGYRYRGRVIGYASDRDAENAAIGATFNEADGTTWSAAARWSRLNLDDFGDVLNTVATVPTRYLALELGWRGRLLGESVSFELGAESIEPTGSDRRVEPYGFARWRHDFAP